MTATLDPGRPKVILNDQSLILATGERDPIDLRSIADRFADIASILGTSGANPSSRQLRQALVNLGGSAIYTVVNAIPADIADPVNMEWSCGQSIHVNGPLGTLIQSTLSFSGAQMAALWADALNQPR